MDPAVKATLAQAAGSGVVAAIGAVGVFMAGRQNGRASFINAVQDAAQKVMDRLEGEIARVTKKCDDAEAAHKACEDAHRQCEERLNELFEAVRAQGLPAYRPDLARRGAPSDEPGGSE